MNGNGQPIDRNTTASRVTWGFAFIIAAGIVGGTAYGQKVDDVADRQAKYIGVNGSITREVEELERDLHELELRVLALETLSSERH